MKKLLISLLLCLSLTTFGIAAYADSGAANIKIKVSGALKDNRYFLCLNGVGCMSVLAAERGKVFSIYHPVEMDNIYLTDVSNNFRVNTQGLPASCNKTVNANQTLTITGNIGVGPKNSAYISQLRCSVS